MAIAETKDSSNSHPRGSKMGGAKRGLEVLAHIEAKIEDPKRKDDPRWLKRMANNVRRRAMKRQKGLEHKASQKRGQRTSKTPDSP